MAVRIKVTIKTKPPQTNKTSGSGLGLYISKQLTDLQDGQIGVHSEPDKGSTFSFYIKARRAVEDDDILEEGTLTTPTLNTPVIYTRDPASNSLQPDVEGQPHDKTHNIIRKLSTVSTDQTEEKPHLHVLVVEVCNSAPSLFPFITDTCLGQHHQSASHVSTTPPIGMYSPPGESWSRSS
jgi:hypothetical protein